MHESTMNRGETDGEGETEFFHSAIERKTR